MNIFLMISCGTIALLCLNSFIIFSLSCWQFSTLFVFSFYSFMVTVQYLPTLGPFHTKRILLLPSFFTVQYFIDHLCPRYRLCFAFEFASSGFSTYFWVLMTIFFSSNCKHFSVYLQSFQHMAFTVLFCTIYIHCKQETILICNSIQAFAFSISLTSSQFFSRISLSFNYFQSSYFLLCVPSLTLCCYYHYYYNYSCLFSFPLFRTLSYPFGYLIYILWVTLLKLLLLVLLSLLLIVWLPNSSHCHPLLLHSTH